MKKSKSYSLGQYVAAEIISIVTLVTVVIVGSMNLSAYPLALIALCLPACATLFFATIDLIKQIRSRKLSQNIN